MQKPKHFKSWNSVCLWYSDTKPSLLYPSHNQQVAGAQVLRSIPGVSQGASAWFTLQMSAMFLPLTTTAGR